MIATSGFLTALECTKFVFGRGSAPKGRKRVGEKRRGKGRGRGRKIRRGGNESSNTPSINSCVHPLAVLKLLDWVIYGRVWLR